MEEETVDMVIALGPFMFTVKKGAHGFNIWMGETFYDSAGVAFATPEKAKEALLYHFREEATQ